MYTFMILSTKQIHSGSQAGIISETRRPRRLVCKTRVVRAVCVARGTETESATPRLTGSWSDPVFLARAVKHSFFQLVHCVRV